MTISCNTTIIGAGAAGSKSKLLTDFQLGWTASAQSLSEITGDGEYSFSFLPSSLGVVTGLTARTVDSGYADIQYGVFFDKGKALVIEGGVNRTSYVGVPVGAVFTIKRLAGVVSYWCDAYLDPLYVSSTPSAAPLVADASMYSAGDGIVGAMLVNYNSASNTLQPLSAYAGVAGQNRGYALLQPLQASPQLQGGRTNLACLTTYAGVAGYAQAVNTLQPLTAYATSGMIEPTYALSAASMPYLNTVAHGITGGVGTSDQSFPALRSIGSDHAYGYSANDMQPAGNMAGEAIKLSGVGQLVLGGNYTVAGHIASQPFNGGNLTLPSVSARAFTGMSAALTFPAVALTVSATIPNIGRGALTLPSLRVVANGTVGGATNGYLDLGGGYTVRGYTGAWGVMRLGGQYAVVGSGATGGLMEAALVFPAMTMAGDVVSEAWMAGDLTLPSLTISTGAVGRLVIPAMVMRGTATLVATAAYEAFSVNLLNGAVTHYTNWPFQNVIRLGNKFYAVKSDGLYLIGGYADVTAPISASVECFKTDFDSVNFKRVPWTYLAGRFSNGVTVEASVDGGTVYPYDTHPVRGEEGVVRAQLGRGLRGTYYTLKFKNIDGGTFDVDRVECVVDILQRAL